MNRRALTLVIQFFTLFFIAGCALKTGPLPINPTGQPTWHGRLAMQVQAHPDDPLSQHQSFGAMFELVGTSDLGQLNFFTPLGSTAAAIRWAPTIATLESQGETRTYDGLSPLVRHLLGTDVPVIALFGWLNGHDSPADGWQVDLRQFAQGKIFAQRLSPLPQAQLRLILEP